MQDYSDSDFNINFDEDFTSKLSHNKDNISQEVKHIDRSNGIIALFLFLTFFLILFIFILYINVTSDRKLPTLEISKKEVAQRGTIYSSDGFNLASSKNLYKVSILKNSIDPDKMEFFIKLLSIYSGMDEDYLKDKLSGKGNIILSYKLNPKTALNLKHLNQKLIKYGIFRSYEENGRVIPKSGLSIEISGESRDYLYKDILEPILGYTNKLETDGYTKPKGEKGIEKSYNNVLTSKQDGIYKGDRDIGFNIVLQKNATIKQKIDGKNIVLTIPLKLQKKIENIVDSVSMELDSKEIAVGIIDSNTGRILSLVSSNRFDPKNIKEDDYSKLNSSFVELSFEPGSIMKPIIYSILLEKRLVNPNEIFNLYNGYYKLGKYTIQDSVKQKYASAENIIVFSSNIGMAQMAQRLNAKTYHNALVAFGFSLPTNIDLPYEKSGIIPSQYTFNSYVYKGSVSYGYGMRATFIQMLRAYAVFANGGYLINPYVRDYTLTSHNKKIDINSSQNKISLLSVYTADTINKTLIKTVKSGTAKQTKVDGLIIGGKTGTARIATNGKYKDKYIGSFFGFVKDNNSNYTIGVVVFESSAKNSYYASQTAAPIAKRVIEALLEEGYLKKIEKNI
ncbi:penicillin-binding protein 2 [Helicobacter sp. MIT 14-3879]|uniref:peptidoglycan D,D-transpeptidase FtsI family protein n=1 Tax=Helicobacter sp. MIT 14-3879 TaxID=2040649 RepID=UPI000E1E6D56|nr:penicillin-binding protein 2 [Helicobacter sp. MIT 14-3879]RDU63514.1 penicillin-binding protein 2 [Helicobacter sp. MIT 14-3879]